MRIVGLVEPKKPTEAKGEAKKTKEEPKKPITKKSATN